MALESEATQQERKCKYQKKWFILMCNKEFLLVIIC
jgi:hypothetical protein